MTWGPPGTETDLAPWEDRPSLPEPAPSADDGPVVVEVDTDSEPWLPWKSVRYETQVVRCRRVGVEWKVLEHRFTERGWMHDLMMKTWSWAPTMRWARWRARRFVASQRDFRRRR